MLHAKDMDEAYALSIRNPFERVWFPGGSIVYVTNPLTKGEDTVTKSPMIGEAFAAQAEQSLSYGERMVGVDFNPSGYDDVSATKMQFAAMIDELNELRQKAEGEGSLDLARFCSVAIINLQTAQMWTVKAMTWKD